MGLADDYRKHAGNLIQIASRQSTSADKGRLLLIAEAWLELADRIPDASNDARPSIIP